MRKIGRREHGMGKPAPLRFAPLLLGAAFLLTSLQSASSQEQPAPGSEKGGLNYNDPDGGVLCYWRMYIGLRELVRLCGKDEDRTLAHEIGLSIERMDEFIIANGPSTKAALDEDRTSLARPVVDGWRLASEAQRREACAPARPGVPLTPYQAMQKRGEVQIRADMDKLLAKPRRPVMNPCL